MPHSAAISHTLRTQARGAVPSHHMPRITFHRTVCALATTFQRTDLMRNAKWNLCPRATQFVSACYYETDQTFSLLSGSLSKVIEDAPDGMWTLNVKNDIFDKVRLACVWGLSLHGFFTHGGEEACMHCKP
eukprot:365554-Chlamydomonas_euryale.AAC.7